MILEHEQDILINFENLVASLADGVYFANPQGIITYVNQGLVNLLGHENSSAMLGHSLYEFVGAANEDKVSSFFDVENSEDSRGKRIEAQLLRCDGSLVWAEVRPAIKMAENCPEGTFAVVRDITEFKRLEERLRNLAITDDLTGLYNRRGFRLMAEQELKHAQRLNNETILLSIDVDDFKSINDTYGHAEGDKVLKLVASTLNESFRNTDIISRWGGDEFIVLALDAPAGCVPLLSDRFQKNLTKNAQLEMLSYPVSVTIGMEGTAIFEDVTLTRLIMSADRNMYQQKKYKQNR